MYNVFARHTKWTPGILTSYPEEALGCSSSLWLYNPPCLCVWKSAGSAGLGSAIAHTTAELLSTACLLSSLHRDWKCPSPEPNRNRKKKKWAKKEMKQAMNVWGYLSAHLPPVSPKYFYLHFILRQDCIWAWLIAWCQRQARARKETAVILPGAFGPIHPLRRIQM